MAKHHVQGMQQLQTGTPCNHKLWQYCLICHMAKQYEQCVHQQQKWLSCSGHVVGKDILCRACSRKGPYALEGVSVAAQQSTAQQALRARSLGTEGPLWRRGSVALPRESAIWETAHEHNQDDTSVCSCSTSEFRRLFEGFSKAFEVAILNLVSLGLL